MGLSESEGGEEGAHGACPASAPPRHAADRAGGRHACCGAAAMLVRRRVQRPPCHPEQLSRSCKRSKPLTSSPDARHGRAASLAGAGEAEPAVIDLTDTPEAASPARGHVGAAAAGHAEPVDSSPDAVLRRCERISADLRSKLGTQEGARCGAVDPDPALPHVLRMLACWTQRRSLLTCCALLQRTSAHPPHLSSHLSVSTAVAHECTWWFGCCHLNGVLSWRTADALCAGTQRWRAAALCRRRRWWRRAAGRRPTSRVTSWWA